SRPMLVGARGFEPPTPCSQSRCATGLRHAPMKLGGESGGNDRRALRGASNAGMTHFRALRAAAAGKLRAAHPVLPAHRAKPYTVLVLTAPPAAPLHGAPLVRSIRMSSLNRVILLGNLGRDPEIRYTQSGTTVANLRIATNERRPDGSGGWQDA